MNDKPATPSKPDAVAEAPEVQEQQADEIQLTVPNADVAVVKNKADKPKPAKPVVVKAPKDGIERKAWYLVQVRGGPKGHQHQRPLRVQAVDQQEAILFSCKALNIAKTHAYHFTVSRETASKK